jgi:TFIIF, beta subunit N-terminus
MTEPVRIKPEATDGGSPFAEDELDESTDLEFYDKNIQGDTYSRMYLARLPSYLWQAWSHLDDDAEIEIGRIRQWKDKDGVLVRLPAPIACLPASFANIGFPRSDCKCFSAQILRSTRNFRRNTIWK